MSSTQSAQSSGFQGFPSKRPPGDDEIEFISCSPVKKQKVNTAQGQASDLSLKTQAIPSNPSQSQEPPAPIHVSEESQQDGIASNKPSPPPIANATQSQQETTNQHQSLDQCQDRRITTGMVGLPFVPQFDDAGLGSRGVSMPAFEGFSLQQPSGRLRSISAPALSPKQQPQLTASMTVAGTERRTSARSDMPPPALPKRSNAPCEGHHVAGKQTEPLQLPTETQSLAEPAHPVTRTASRPSVPLVNLGPPSGPRSAPASDGHALLNLPSFLPSGPPMSWYSESTRAPTNRPEHGLPVTLQERTETQQTCRGCLQVQHCIALAKAQGLAPWHPQVAPTMAWMATSMPHCFSQQTQFMGIPSAGTPGPEQSLHTLTPMWNVGKFPGHGPSQGDSQPFQLGPHSSRAPMVPRYGLPSMEPKPAMAAGPGSSGCPRHVPPANPPQPFVQPTYRKHSPNLIVDIAETCERTFPFKEIAERHRINVEKVFEVFSAIIQTPLLRCPTDRRRHGKLATTRQKQYDQAKQEIQKYRNEAHGASGEAESGLLRRANAPTPVDVARQLGTTDFPKDFVLPGQE